MALQDAAENKPRATKRAMHAQCFERVRGTRRLKAAVAAHHQTQRHLTEAHQRNQRPGERTYPSACSLDLDFADFFFHAATIVDMALSSVCRYSACGSGLCGRTLMTRS